MVINLLRILPDAPRTYLSARAHTRTQQYIQVLQWFMPLPSAFPTICGFKGRRSELFRGLHTGPHSRPFHRIFREEFVEELVLRSAT